LGARGRAAKGRLGGDDQTKNDALSEVFHASPAEINGAREVRQDEEASLYHVSKRFALARWPDFRARITNPVKSCLQENLTDTRAVEQ